MAKIFVQKKKICLFQKKKKMCTIALATIHSVKAIISAFPSWMWWTLCWQNADCVHSPLSIKYDSWFSLWKTKDKNEAFSEPPPSIPSCTSNALRNGPVKHFPLSVWWLNSSSDQIRRGTRTQHHAYECVCGYVSDNKPRPVECSRMVRLQEGRGQKDNDHSVSFIAYITAPPSVLHVKAANTHSV